MTGGDTGEGDEWDVESGTRACTRAHSLTKCDNSWGGIMRAGSGGVERPNNYSPAMHSTAETVTAVSAIYRPTSGRLPQG